VLRSGAQSEFGGLGHRCQNPLCQWVGLGLRCGVIGRGVRGTAQVVNDSGSAVLAANAEMICLGSPAFCALRVFSSSSPFYASPTGMPA
jgi:hypothetical protein